MYIAHLVIKSLVSGIIIMLVSETAKRNAALGALIASLPLISILGMIWLWQGTKDINRLATHSAATFWYVLPSLPMFLILPWLLKNNIDFYFALIICCIITCSLYLVSNFLMTKYNV